MTHYTRKKPAAEINYTIDLSQSIDADEHVTSAVWSLTDAIYTGGPAVTDLSSSGGPVINGSTLAGTDATVNVTGGTLRKAYPVYLRAPTDKNQVLVDDLTIQII